MVSIDQSQAPEQAKAASGPNKLYFAAWRWHFYAGLYAIPFFIMLSVTGMLMMWIAFVAGRDGERIAVVPQETVAAISTQAQAALEAVPGGTLKQYVAPRSPELAALFRVDEGDQATMVAVDPYTASVLSEYPRRSGIYDLMDEIHGTLLLGVTGDVMIEIAASLGMVLLATGLYLWWPRGTSWRAAFFPKLTKGRSLWKSLHGAVGLWVSVFLFLFLISGLAWAGVWGAKMVQAWNQFPAEKWNDVPLSDVTHGSMNNGPKEVPWALELTPMPASGSVAGAEGIADGIPVTLDTVDHFAREIGFEGRYQMNLPKGDTGVWTLSQDSMSTDSTNPTADRTMHVDQYTGRILADVRYEDYSLFGKFMAVGIALHMGTLGIWSVLANSLICLAVILSSVSGIVMWWKRRPSGSARLAPPPMPRDMPLWQGAVLVGLFVSMAFPLAGLTLLAVLTLDVLILSKLPALRRVFA